MKQIEDVFKLMHEYKSRTSKSLKTIRMSHKTFAEIHNEFLITSGGLNPEFNGAIIEFCTEAEEDMFYKEIL